ncbi:MAG: hypothetical protein AAGI23_14075 [Bacteroidota bacterium]
MVNCLLAVVFNLNPDRCRLQNDYLIVILVGCLLMTCGNPEQSVTHPNDRAEDVLRSMYATYEYEQSMLIDSSQRVEFTISKGWQEELIRDLVGSFDEGDALAQEAIMVGDFVTVELVDPSQGNYFSIVPLSVSRQRITQQDTVLNIWQWNVQPLQTGNLPLVMRAFTTVDGEDHNIPVFDAIIEVKSRVTDPVASPPDYTVWYVSAGLLLLFGIGFFIYDKKQPSPSTKKVLLPAALAVDLSEQIGGNRTLQALEKLETYLRDHQSRDLTDVLTLKASWLENRRKGNLNVIDDETESIENARINLATLELLEVLKGEA